MLETSRICQKRRLPNMRIQKSKIKRGMPSLLHACGVTVNGPGRISSRNGTVAWTSGTFITIQENPDFGNLTQIHTKRAVCCLSVSPDGRRIATGESGKDPCVRVYNRDTEKYTSKLQGHSFEIVAVEWHRNENYLASCGNVHDRQIIIWDTKRNIQVATSRLNTEPKQIIFYHKHLITIGKGMIKYWTIPEVTNSNLAKALTGRNVALKSRRDATFTDMAVTSSALFIVSPEGIGKLTTTRTLQSWCDLQGRCNCITSVQNLLLVGIYKLNDSRVLIMNENFKQLSLFQPGGDPPTPVACQPYDDTHIVIVYEDRSCALMQIDDDNDPVLIDELPAINGYVSSIIRTSADRFITGSQDSTFRGWTLQQDQFVANFNLLTEAPIKCVSINQDQSFIALGLENGNVVLYKADIEEEWKFHTRIQCHDAAVLCMSWNQRLLATGGRDRFVHVIEIDPHDKNSPTRTTVPLKMHTSNVTAVHWMKDEHDTYRLITGGADKALFFMTLTSDSNFDREKWIQINWPIYDIKGALNAYVACGKYIQSYDNNGEEVKTFEFDKPSKVTSIALKEDESILAGCSSNQVVVFDTTSSNIIQIIEVPCMSIAIINDYIITGDADGTLVCWQLRNLLPQEPLRRTLSRQSILPTPHSATKAKSRRDTCPPNILEKSSEKRRSQWSTFPTPFKIKSMLDTSAVTIFDEEDEEEGFLEEGFPDLESIHENLSDKAATERKEEDEGIEDTTCKDETVKEVIRSPGNSSPVAKKSNSSFENDSLEMDALFGDCKGYSDTQLDEIFQSFDGRASLSSNANKRLSDQGLSPNVSGAIPEETGKEQVTEYLVDLESLDGDPNSGDSHTHTTAEKLEVAIKKVLKDLESVKKGDIEAHQLISLGKFVAEVNNQIWSKL